MAEVFAIRGGWRKGQTRQFDYYANSWSEGKPPLEYDGLEMLLLRFEGGAIGKVSVNFDAVQPYTFPVEIFGDRGTVRDNRIWSHKFPGQNGWIEIPAVGPVSSDVTHHPFQAQMDHFVDCIIEGRESHCNLEDAANTHEAVFAAQRCYETGRPERVPAD